MISAILFISFFIFLILGVPIGICLGLSSVCAILYSGTSLTIVATNMYSGISKFLLLAIPFFVLSGNIMAKAGISKRLIKFVDTCVGHKKGGIAIVCVIVACFFGAISGSGTTRRTVEDAEAAKKLGVKVIAVTSKPESPLAAAADAVIVVPGRVKGEAGGSIQLLSSLFDQSVHIALDALCLMLSRRDNVSDADANANHANVE